MAWCDGGRALRYSFAPRVRVADGSVPFPDRGSGDGACLGEMPKSATFPALVWKSGI